MLCILESKSESFLVMRKGRTEVTGKLVALGGLGPRVAGRSARRHRLWGWLWGRASGAAVWSNSSSVVESPAVWIVSLSLGSRKTLVCFYDLYLYYAYPYTGDPHTTKPLGCPPEQKQSTSEKHSRTWSHGFPKESACEVDRVLKIYLTYEEMIHGKSANNKQKDRTRPKRTSD